MKRPVRENCIVYPDLFYRDGDLCGGRWVTGVPTTTNAHRIMTKKEDEKNILEKFIDKSDMNIQILSFDNAIKEFPDYNNENPDFIISFNNELIGIELFELVSSQYVPSVLLTEEQKLNIVNLRHLKSKREKLSTKLLYENEDLGKVAVERINSKDEKIKIYVTDKVWLIGYANEKYNFSLIKTYTEDGELNNIRKYINSNITVNDRVVHIYLVQCCGREIIFEIK